MRIGRVKCNVERYGIRLTDRDIPSGGISCGIYEECIFDGCDLTGADLSDSRFYGCEFIECNLCNTLFDRCRLSDVSFKNCKITGVRFDAVDALIVTIGFSSSTLDVCDFTGMNLKGISIKESRVRECFFEDADLSESVLTDSDFEKTRFFHTDMQKSDLRGSFNLDIDPTQNNVKGACFSYPGVMGLLAPFEVRIYGK